MHLYVCVNLHRHTERHKYRDTTSTTQVYSHLVHVKCCTEAPTYYYGTVKQTWYTVFLFLAHRLH